MDSFETIRQRRSIRSYTDEEVTEEEIKGKAAQYPTFACAQYKIRRVQPL
jgi:nitroreductase